ncbi:MAG TPA: MJ0042-type zinc finger domain-containing protein [Gemmataceae bacterium]|nr:MJ0042-type zinc finger domain-containing protein [Gemmataceae bacterium]
MPANMHCPSCGTPIRIIEEYVGRTARCPKCDHAFVVPPPGDAVSTSSATEGGFSDLGRAAAPRTRPTRSSSGSFLRVTTVILAGLGCALGGTALGLVLFRDPLGGGMKRYRFSTPKDSLISQLQIEQNKDIRAMMELTALGNDPKVKEKLRTLEVRKEADWKGDKILFIVYEDKGVKKYETTAFERDVDSGVWFPKYVSRFDVENSDKDLAERMRAWEEQAEPTKAEPNFPPPPAAPDAPALPDRPRLDKDN